jgi:hypothetical protein
LRADPETAHAVRAGINALFDALKTNRLDAALACFVPDSDSALIGSEVGEIAIGAQAIRLFLSSLLERPGPGFEMSEPVALSVSGNTAWFAGDAIVEVAGMRVPYRLAGVLVRRDDRWLWALFSGSEPVPPR